MTFKVRIPGDWIHDIYSKNGTYLEVSPPVGLGLTKYTMPKYDIEDEGDDLAFYFIFDAEIEAIYFKLKYL